MTITFFQQHVEKSLTEIANSHETCSYTTCSYLFFFTVVIFFLLVQGILFTKTLMTPTSTSNKKFTNLRSVGWMCHHHPALSCSNIQAFKEANQPCDEKLRGVVGVCNCDLACGFQLVLPRSLIIDPETLPSQKESSLPIINFSGASC